MYSDRSRTMQYETDTSISLPPSASTIVFPVIAAPPIVRVINHHHSPVSNHPIRRHIPPRTPPRLFPRRFPRRCFYRYFQLLLRLFTYTASFSLFLLMFFFSAFLSHLNFCISLLHRIPRSPHQQNHRCCLHNRRLSTQVHRSLRSRRQQFHPRSVYCFHCDLS